MREKSALIGAAAVMIPVLLATALALAGHASAEDWPQLKYDSRRSGNVPERALDLPLGLVGAAPLTDAVLTAPVIADGRVYVLDAAGVVTAFDAQSLANIWQFRSGDGKANANNVSSPAIAGPYLHFGTTAGTYYVLDRDTGKVVRELDVGEPILSASVVVDDRVYFATLGAKVYAVKPDGEPRWTWDFVEEVLGFKGDRFDGAAWLKHKGGRVTWRDSFCVSTDIAAVAHSVVVPVGGRTVWLEDAGDKAVSRATGIVPEYAGSEYPATFGQSIGEDGAVYRQWHRRNNAGRVEVFRLGNDNNVTSSFVPGTETAINLPGLLSFSSVSLRGQDVFRCRPEQGWGLAVHAAGETRSLAAAGSIASPILAGEHAVYGGLDGKLHIVPLRGKGAEQVFATAWSSPITAPAAVADGRVYFGGEDGYLYVLGKGGEAALPTREPELWKIRSPVTSARADSRYDWFTNYGDFGSTNANDQGLRPPLKIKWIRRYEGTFKHLPICGGGRLYTHTSEGQIFAVEQETGRLLWRRYFPGVYLSFTAPLYYQEKLLVPQAGLEGSRLRCFDAARGTLLWESPFSGSPSWSRQMPPVVHEGLAIYMFGSGRYAPQGSEKAYVHKGTPEPGDGREVMSFIYGHNNPYYPEDNRPLVVAWDLETGREVWRQDFSAYGRGGNDAGVCLMDGVLYYSTFFGYAARRRGEPGPRGLTAALDPATGRVLWSTTDYYVTAGCTISARDGRLYLGGYNQPREGTTERYVWCLDARDGSLIWQSDPVASAVNVITVGERFLFSNASGKDGHMLDRETGKILGRFNFGYACTRFTLSEPYLLGANIDLIDLERGNQLAATGPAIDSRECVGSIVSNGRLFYTSQASGLQVSESYGEEAEGGGDREQGTGNSR